MRMDYKKAKWLIYTVLVGMLPIIFRILIYMIMKEKKIALIMHESDFVAFGLILHITNLNELEHIKIDDKSWKTIQNGISIIFISGYLFHSSYGRYRYSVTSKLL